MAGDECKIFHGEERPCSRRRANYDLRRVEVCLQDLLYPRVCVVILRRHSCISHLRKQRSQKTTRLQKLERVEGSSATGPLYAASVAAQRLAHGGWELWPFGGACMRRRTKKWPLQGHRRGTKLSRSARRTRTTIFEALRCFLKGIAFYSLPDAFV